jgi:hypothetical protein
MDLQSSPFNYGAHQWQNKGSNNPPVIIPQGLLQSERDAREIEVFTMSDHKEHMCEYSRHHGVKDMRERVKDPKFICEVCGRAATKKEYLCRPVEL